MRIYPQVLLMFAFCFHGIHNFKSTENNTERYSHVRYLTVHQKEKSNRPYFFWESNPITKNPLEPIEETAFRKIIPQNVQTEENISQKRRTRKSKSKRLRNTNKAVLKRSNTKGKRRKKLKKNRKYENNGLLEIPYNAKNITGIKYWAIRNNTDLQDLINKLNKNPEVSYHDLLGKYISGPEVKIPRSNNRTHLLGSQASGTINPTLTSPPTVNEPHTKIVKFPSFQKKFEASKGVFQFTPLGGNGFQLPGSETKRRTGSRRNRFPNDSRHLKDINVNNAASNNSLLISGDLNITQVKPSDGIKRSGECDFENGGCSHLCNEASIRRCSCMEGFVLGKDQKECLDINECVVINGGCQYHCFNTPGSFYCTCPKGYHLSDDRKNCDDINECLAGDGHGPCEDTCINTIGSYVCGCSRLKTTVLGRDSHSCVTPDDCESGKSGCSHKCTNKEGVISCSCPEDMELKSDGKTCKDLQNNQLPETKNNSLCQSLRSPQHGYIYCVQEQIVSNDIKIEIESTKTLNDPGTFCQLVCTNGFKNVGDFQLTCNDEGKWIGEADGTCSRISVLNYNPHYNYIDVSWVYSKPRIKCPKPITFHLEENQEIAYMTYDAPKTSIDWKYVESIPSWGKDLEAHLPPGNHWITFKVTDPYTKLTAKCILYITVKKLNAE